MEYPSKLIEDAVNEISRLPGIGKKTALRLALHLLKKDVTNTEDLSEALLKLRKNTKYCNTCHMISDSVECTCMTARKDTSYLCIVEDTPDIIAIENTAQYNGLYHVLGGIISPMNGIGPGELNIDSLVNRLEKDGQIKEIILALSPTMEGDTTAYYITKRVKHLNIKVSTIARGIPIGGELEYADEITLGRSILNRVPFDLNHQ